MVGEDKASEFSAVKLLIDRQVAESWFLIQWEKGKRIHTDMETHTHTHPLFICVSWSVCGSMKFLGELLRNEMYSIEELEF